MPWTDALLPGAVLVLSSADGFHVEVGYEGPNARGVMVSTVSEYTPTGPDQLQAVYNAVFWAGGYDR